MVTEQENLDEKIAAIEKETRSFVCPHCQTDLQFLVRLYVVGVRELTSPQEYAAAARPYRDVPKKDPLTPDERATVEQAREAGVLTAFEEAVRVRSVPAPKDMEKFFITFLRCAARMKTPQFAIRLCLPPEDESRELELWATNDIAVVIADGQFKCFLPQSLIKGKTIAKLTTASGKPKTGETITLETWIKTRNGYVVGRGLMFGEMKRKAAGSFDTMNL